MRTIVAAFPPSLSARPQTYPREKDAPREFLPVCYQSGIRVSRLFPSTGYQYRIPPLFLSWPPLLSFRPLLPSLQNHSISPYQTRASSSPEVPCYSAPPNTVSTL